MIVLAIMGFLFISATILVSGEQNKTEFNGAIQQAQSVIQQHINEVGAGFYSNSGNFKCSAAGTSVSITSSSDNTQGTNGGCIFLGKAIQFGVKNTNPQQMITYTVAGLQNNNGNLSDTHPMVVAPSTANPTVPNDSTIDQLQNGLTVVRMTNGSISSDNTIGAVAFVNGLGSYNPNNDQLLSGSQQVSVIPVKNSALQQTSSESANVINNYLAADMLLSPDGVQICFASGTTNQSGLVTIGGQNRQLTVTLDIKNGRSCGV